MLTPIILSRADDFAREFQRCCQAYDSLQIATAWCGCAKHVLPFAYLQNFKGRVVAVIGTSFSHTHPDALDFLINIGSDLRVFPDDSDLFHPKVYLFTQDKKVALFIGSSNLTYSGFFSNIETNVLLEGIPEGDALQQMANLRKRLKDWYAASFRPSPAWLASYRKSYEAAAKAERKHGISSPPRYEEKIATASWLRNADWKTYYHKVQEGFRQHDRDGQGYLDVLDAAQKLIPVPWSIDYFADAERRRVIGGMGDYGWLGHVAAAGQFRHLMAKGSRTQFNVIVESINRTARFSHPIPWAELDSELRRLMKLGFTMKIWGRLLCLVRPDLYCTVASVSVRKNLSEALAIPRAAFQRPDGYIQLHKLGHASPWFNSGQPASETEGAVWRRRVAFMDAIFY